VDLTRTAYLDSAGVQLLFRLASKLRIRRHRMRLVVPEGSPVRTVLEIAGMPKVLPLEREFEIGSTDS
jgi:anti-anti-sigma factor